ncbi:dihydrolipoamide acetyltransferase family protein [Sphingobium sp.]|uniref:dihydrolipoamide acetyltransferase family protein n=1 Tax=Sphingobium sp. TaxID=1912891 RepID=UPI003B3BD998
MAGFEFRLPDIGEGTAEAECVAWHVSVGDWVEEDQPLLDVMTDKATVEVTSPVGGIVIDRHGNPGDMLQVGSTILVFDQGDEPVATLPSSPVVLAPVLSERTADEPVMVPPPTRIVSTPAVRKRARDMGIDIADVRGSGPAGRVRQVDLDAHVRRAGMTVPDLSLSVAPHATMPVADDHEYEDIPVIGLRRKIAERMQDTKRRIPHFSYIEEVDVGPLERLRAELNVAPGHTAPRLTLLPFLIRALSRTLPEFPQMNARYDDQAGVVRRYRSCHVGIATQTPAGLVVTVVKDAGKRSLWDNALEIGRLSDRARAGKAGTAELSGSTITITSLGAMGGLATTPVINSPEVAILGVNKIVERPIIRDGRIEVTRMMNISASFDHRIIDGWDAALFIQRIKSALEAPAKLFMD